MHAAVQTVQVPGLAVADVFVQYQRLVLGQNTHRVDSRVHAVGKREINDTILSAKRHRRFGKPLGQRIKPRPLAAGQQHCNTFFHDRSPLFRRLPAPV